MSYYHPETQQKFSSKQEAQSKLKVLSPKLVVTVFAPRPDLNPGQIKTLDILPTEVDGVWTYGWTVTDLPAEEVAVARMEAAAKECGKRIHAVADATAQMNMASAASANMLSEDQMTAWKQALAWVQQMRGTWQAIAADTTKDITDDVHWPECPVAAAALADGF